MENVSVRGVEIEAAAAVRFNQFRGLPVNVSLPDVSDGPPAQTPRMRIKRELQLPQSAL